MRLPPKTTALSWWQDFRTLLRPEELCWRELKFLAGSPKADRSTDRGQKKSRLLVLQMGVVRLSWYPTH